MYYPNEQSEKPQSFPPAFHVPETSPGFVLDIDYVGVDAPKVTDWDRFGREIKPELERAFNKLRPYEQVESPEFIPPNPIQDGAGGHGIPERRAGCTGLRWNGY